MAAYGTDEGFADWLDAQGYTLPETAPSPAVLRNRGSAYVDGYEALWTGYRTGGALQELAWPRTGARFSCVQAIPDDIIPPSIINASYRAAWLDAETPGILVGSSAGLGQRVKRERVEGAVDVEYFDDGKPGSSGGPSFIDSMIDGALRAFVCDDSKSAAFLWTLGS
jgi:transcription elongation factor